MSLLLWLALGCSTATGHYLDREGRIELASALTALPNIHTYTHRKGSEKELYRYCNSTTFLYNKHYI